MTSLTEYFNDQALQVKCPTCRAAIGQPCKRPRSRKKAGPHFDRINLASKKRAEEAEPLQ